MAYAYQLLPTDDNLTAGNAAQRKKFHAQLSTIQPPLDRLAGAAATGLAVERDQIPNFGEQLIAT